MPSNGTTEKILEFIIASRGKKVWPPNMTDIAEHFGIAKGSVQYHINILKEEGRVFWFDAKSGWKAKPPKPKTEAKAAQ